MASILSLPDELILLMLSFLPKRDVATTAKVSARLREVARDPSLWKFGFRPHSVTSAVLLGEPQSGKSTLLGRLMVALHVPGAPQPGTTELATMHTAAAGIGANVFQWYVATRQERSGENGVRTIEGNRKTVLLHPVLGLDIWDTSGQDKYSVHAVRAVQKSDFAIIVIDYSANTTLDKLTVYLRQRFVLTYAAGIRFWIIAVTHIDHDAPPHSFADIRKAALEAGKKSGCRPSNVHVVPVSGLTGWNILPGDKSAPPANVPTDGPSFVEVLTQLAEIDLDGRLCLQQRLAAAPFRMLIDKHYTQVSKPTHQGLSESIVVTGRIAAGQVAVGKTLVLFPTSSGRVISKQWPGYTNYPQVPVHALVKSIQRNRRNVTSATYGQYVSLQITSVKAPSGPIKSRVLRDNVINNCVGSLLDNQPITNVAAEIMVQLITVKAPTRGILPGSNPVMLLGGQAFPCRITQLLSRMDRRTGKEIEKNPQRLPQNSAGLATMRPLLPAVIEVFDKSRALGSFVLMDNNIIEAVGIVKEGRLDE